MTGGRAQRREHTTVGRRRLAVVLPAVALTLVLAASGLWFFLPRPDDAPARALTAPAPSPAAEEPAAILAADEYIVGEAYEVAVSAGEPHEGMTLAVRSGQEWREVDASVSDAVGDSALRWDAPTGQSPQLRVSSGGRILKSWTVRRAKVQVTLEASGYSIEGAASPNRVVVAGAPVATRVSLQRKTGKGWVEVKHGVTGEDRSVSLPWTPAHGHEWIRAVATSPAGRAVSTAADIMVVKRCTAGTVPAAELTYMANDPTRLDGSGIVDPLIGAICAADQGSDIFVSLYILAHQDAAVKPILNALKNRARVTKSRVVFLVETAQGGVQDLTVKSLRSWAEVRTCELGCTAFGDDTSGINHNKFVAISDTVWSKTVDPWVWYSSANWSNRQLREYWHNAVGVYNNTSVYADTAREIGVLTTCEKGEKECASTGLTLTEEVSAYGHAPLSLPAAGAQRGVTVQADFFPKTGWNDPVEALLANMSCTPGQDGTVRIAGYLWSKSRANRVMPHLRRLVKEGCTAEIIASEGGLFATAPKTLKILKDPAVRFVSRDLMHLKTVQADHVTFRGAQDRFVWYGGAQNFTAFALRTNNENMLLVEAPSGTGETEAFQRGAQRNWDEVWSGVAKR